METEYTLSPAEEAAYMRVYGVVSTESPSLHSMFVLFHDNPIPFQEFNDGDYIIFMDGIEEDFYDGKLKVFVDQLMERFEPDDVRTFLEGVVTQGFEHFRSKYPNINHDDPVMVKFEATSQVIVDVYEEMTQDFTELYVNDLIAEIFSLGISVGFHLKPHQVLGYSFN